MESGRLWVARECGRVGKMEGFMRCRSFREFLSAERGSATVWSVTWFSLFVAFAGVSVDSTRGFQMKTMLQGTADAAALAAVIDLPREDQAAATAIAYAETNLPPEIYGNVLTSSNVELGKWDAENHIFAAGEAQPDAVRVRVSSSEETGNPVMTNFLRIIGVMNWDVSAVAIAQRFIPRCFTDGLVARGYVDTSSNNQYFNQFCVHGQQGVHIQSGNYFEPETNVSMPDLDLLQLPASGMESNPGLPAALRAGFLNPRMVDHVPEIINALLDPSHPDIPTWINTDQPVITVNTQFKLSDAIPGRIYHVTCSSPNKQINIPSTKVLVRLIVVSDCQVGIPAGAELHDVIIASQAPASNDGANIHFSSNIRLGRDDNCADGGGVQFFTTESLFISSSATFNGVQFISAKDVTMGASDEGVKGLSVQAGGNIFLSSGNMFGLCPGDDPLLFTHHYTRLVF